MYNWRAPLQLFFFFFERLSWTEGIRANLSREKKNHSCSASTSRFVFVFESFLSYKFRTKFLFFFTFTSQCKLFELLSYGEYNHIFISVICFVKTTHLSIVLIHWFSFLVSNKVHPHHFSAFEINCWSWSWATTSFSWVAMELCRILKLWFSSRRRLISAS